MQARALALALLFIYLFDHGAASAQIATVQVPAKKPVSQEPSSTTLLASDELRARGAHASTDALRFDASIGDSYNAVGYAEQFSLRGFVLDNNASYRKDGIAISADTQIPLENKERIEILKGFAGVQAGVASAGGAIDYVLKRPTGTMLRSATLEARERGTLYAALDLGGRFADPRLGYRINVAGERYRSYVKGADGHRSFASVAIDWRVTPDLLVQLDADYQHKVQLSNTGYQPIAGRTLPAHVAPSMLLNDQPWMPPTDTRSSNLGLHAEYRSGGDWRATISANRHRFQRDDAVLFPYGCSNEGAGFYPGYCSNGDYDAYDYRSAGEARNPAGYQAALHKGALSVGVGQLTRTDRFGDYVYQYVGSSNIYRNVVLQPAPETATTNIHDRRHHREQTLFVRDAISLGARTALHAGLGHTKVRRDAGFEAVHTLPSLALVQTLSDDWHTHASWARTLEHGGIASFLTANEYATLAPSASSQLEWGLRGRLGPARIDAALFRISQALEYTDAANVFVSRGKRTHTGIDVSSHGDAGALRWQVSMMGVRSRQSGTGDASLDGRRIANVPSFKSVSTLDYAIGPLTLSAEWQYAARKFFDNANTLKVPAYHVFGLGAAHAARRLTLRVNVDNVADTFYWRDATPLAGGYLFPGAPRTLRVAALFDL